MHPHEIAMQTIQRAATVIPAQSIIALAYQNSVFIPSPTRGVFPMYQLPERTQEHPALINTKQKRRRWTHYGGTPVAKVVDSDIIQKEVMEVMPAWKQAYNELPLSAFGD